jgi:hypothetical protein
MTKEKKEALKQINQLKESLVDNKKFVPYDPNALIMWGVVTSILFIFAQEILERFGIVAGAIFLASFISTAAFIEHNMTKKVNKKYEIEALTKKQKFMESIYMFQSLFSILMTAVLFQAGAMNLIYVVWIFLIGFTSYTAGHIMNQKSFTYHGVVSALVAFGILYLIYFTPNGLEDRGLSILFRVLAVIFLGGGFVWLGITLKKESNV